MCTCSCTRIVNSSAEKTLVDAMWHYVANILYIKSFLDWIQSSNREKSDIHEHVSVIFKK